MPRKILGLREYARHRGVHHSSVQAAVDNGRLTPRYDKKGKPLFIPSIHDEQWDQSTDPSKQNRKKEKKEVGGSTSADPQESPAKKNQAGDTYMGSRALREAYQARLAKLDWEVKSGKLISADKVKMDAYRVARTVRDTLLNVPDRIAAQIAALTGVHDTRIHDLIAGEIRLALEELVNANKPKS